MKKHSKFYWIYLLSFIMYSLIWFATPYVTARLWADIVMCIFLAAVGYQLVYLFYLRKKDQMKFGRALALYFLCLFCSQEIFAIIDYVDLFINGYVARDFLGNQIGERVFGFEAIRKDRVAHFIYLRLFIISTVYQLIYFVVVSLKGKIDVAHSLKKR